MCIYIWWRKFKGVTEAYHRGRDMSQTLWMAPKPAKDFSLESFPLAVRYLTTDIEGYY